MMMKYNKSKSGIISKNLILLFELGFAIKFNIVGSISLSEMFLICTAPMYLLKIRWNDRDTFIILSLYACLFFSQVVSEIVVGNSFSNAIKGLAITVVSFLHFFFLFGYLKKDPSLIAFLVLSLILSSLISGPQAFLKDNEVSAEDIAEGVAVTFLKFYLAPLLINVFLLISCLIKWKHFSYCFVLLGVIFVVLGARSSGLITLLTGLLAAAVEMRPLQFRGRNLIKGLIVFVVLGYVLYAIYATLVLNGNISAGNSEQILKCNNPYNPIELLLRGRAETYVGWVAFTDSFLFGHGAWTEDNTGHYLHMIQKLHQNYNAIDPELGYLINAHSVIVGAGTTNGVFAFFSMLGLLLFILRKGIKSISIVTWKYRIVFVSFLFSLTWNSLFSPMSHFRLYIPLYLVVILILSKKGDIKSKRRIYLSEKTRNE